MGDEPQAGVLAELDCEESVTLESVHAWIYAQQMRYLGWLPHPVREMLAGVLVLPLLWLTEWGKLHEMAALLGFVLGSGIYERVFAGYKLSDELWRAAGAALVTLGWWLL